MFERSIWALILNLEIGEIHIYGSLVMLSMTCSHVFCLIGHKHLEIKWSGRKSTLSTVANIMKKE